MLLELEYYNFTCYICHVIIAINTIIMATSKYDINKIRREAGRIYKEHEGLLSFSNCLKAAWTIEKKHIALLAPKSKPVVCGSINLTVGKTKYYCGDENSGMRIRTIKKK